MMTFIELLLCRLPFLMREVCGIQTVQSEVDVLTCFQDLSNHTSMCLCIFMMFPQDHIIIKVFNITYLSVTISLPESIMETCSVVLTFESVD